jgi:outer membrane biosynthesis protein TonB
VTFFLAALTLLYGQEGEFGSSSNGRPFVPESVMASHCTTMVSPRFPLAHVNDSNSVQVVLRVRISRSGAVFPITSVAGPHDFESAAMDAARLWKFKPYVKDNDPIEVVTEVQVDFTPGVPSGMISHPVR